MVINSISASAFALSSAVRQITDATPILLKRSRNPSLFEQRIGDAAVSGRERHLAFASDNLRLERRYAFFQLVDRQRIKVLPDQIGQRIVAAQRKVFVGFHITYFDTTTLAVNIKLP